MARIKKRQGILSTGVKVISYNKSQSLSKNEAYWDCQCPICKNIWTVRGSRLNEPNPISMCKQCSSLKNLKKIKSPYSKDITGLRFGKLIAIEKTNKKGCHTYIWKCKCDCGRLCEKELTYLLNGDVKSCGCNTNSFGEEKIIIFLNKNNIPFEKEKILFKQYRFDFFVKKQYIIQYDGKQHFKKSQWESLKEIRKRDLIKNQYCFDNNIPLIRIPYNKDFLFQDLIPLTSHFILTKENENEYYSIG